MSPFSLPSNCLDINSFARNHICFGILSEGNICLVAFPLTTITAFPESSPELPTLSHHKQNLFHSKKEPVQNSHQLKGCKSF